MAKTITIKQVKSIIGQPPFQKKCIQGLGLRRVGHKRVLENTPSVRGMIKKVLHLVEVVSEQ